MENWTLYELNSTNVSALSGTFTDISGSIIYIIDNKICHIQCSLSGTAGDTLAGVLIVLPNEIIQSSNQDGISKLPANCTSGGSIDVPSYMYFSDVSALSILKKSGSYSNGDLEIIFNVTIEIA